MAGEGTVDDLTPGDVADRLRIGRCIGTSRRAWPRAGLRREQSCPLGRGGPISARPITSSTRSARPLRL